MSKADDELTRRLRRAERPVDGDGLFEGLARRRSHRERVRRVQGGFLAFAVLAATAGGFVLLREAFDTDQRSVGDERTSSPVANGEIVFSRVLPDGSEHLFAVQPGAAGERLITSGSAIYTDPSVASDGLAIAVVHSIPSFADMNAEGVIATFTMDGGEPTWITDPLPRVGDPSWSPEGDLIAFAGATTAGLPGIYVMDADGSGMRLVVELDGFTLSAPEWSPDGRRLVFVGLAAATSEARPVNPDLYTVEIDGSELTTLTQTPTVSEWSPSWSPEGDLIAYHRNEGNVSNSIQLIDSTGRPAGTVFDDSDVGEIGEVDWSPDGRLIAFTSSLALTDTDDEGDLDVWTVRPNGSDLRNLTTEGASGIAWQPVPAGTVPEPSPTPEPTMSPRGEPDGRDIGLGFNLCHVERMDGIDFLGDGTMGTAWTGNRTTPEGKCPDSYDDRYGVAADFTGDGVADSWWGGIEFCLFCEPTNAVDLDADGDEELVVVESRSSTPSFLILTAVRDAEGQPHLRPVVIAPPGHEAAGKIPGQPLRISVGGDEGYSAWVRCEHFPAAPVLVLTWRDHPIEGDTMEVHETRVVIHDDVATVTGASDDTAPVESDIPNVSEAPACGVDWLVWD